MTSTSADPATPVAPDPETRALPTLAYVVTGVATLALGIMVLAWPGKTLAVVAALVGVQLLFIGVLQLAGAFRSPAPIGIRVLLAVLGLAAVVAGVVCLLSPFTSLSVLVFWVAIGWFAQGIADAVAGARAKGTRRLGLWGLAVIAVIGAIVLLAWPALSLLVMVRFAGWFLIILGLSELFTLVLRPGKGA